MSKMETQFENLSEINDAKLEAMRACVQFPVNAHFAEEINAFRALTKRVL